MNVTVIDPRETALGGEDAIVVRRTLPSRDRAMVGAWCFCDHYGPIDVAAGGRAMDVAPHPHTGLQTCSWLFAGEIEHHDSDGVHAFVRPGEMNLMTAGDGIAHSEVTTAATTVLHGVQLWIALPESARHTARAFQSYAAAEVAVDGGRVRVFVGAIERIGAADVETHTPLLGAELHVEPGATLRLPARTDFEHGVLVDAGAVTWEGTRLATCAMGLVEPGLDELVLTAGEEGAHLLLLGGAPFQEEILMWWNFIERTHDEVARDQADWNAGAERFGTVEGYRGHGSRILAPGLPPGTLRTRGRYGRADRH